MNTIIRRIFVVALAVVMTVVFSSGAIFATVDMTGTGSGWKANVNLRQNSSKVKVGDTTYRGVVMKVTADQSGTGAFTVKYKKGTHDTVNVAVGETEKEYTGEYGYKDLKKGKSTVVKHLVTKGQTYYIVVYQSETGKKFKDSVSVDLKITTSKVWKLSTKEPVTVTTDPAYDYYWFKFKAKKSGAAAIKPIMAVADNAPKYGKNIGSMRIQMSDGKSPSALRDVEYGKEVKFGVKKGKTYFVFFRPKAKYYKAYNVSLTNTKYSAGKKTKAKAKTLKTSVDSYVVAGKKQTHWYKVDVTAGSHSFILGRDMASDVEMKVYKGKKKVKNLYNGVPKNLKAGTYYVKITTKDMEASGIYNLTYR